MIVTVGLRKPLQIEDPLAAADPPPRRKPVGKPEPGVRLRQGEVNFQTEINNGCKTTYGLNYDDWSTKDGDKEWTDILCDGYPSRRPAAADHRATNPAPICVAVETGDKIGQFRKGLTKRFETPTCWPNNWPEDQPRVAAQEDAAIRDFFKNHDFANDPRYVTLIITDFGTFEGSGNDQVPVKYFAGLLRDGLGRQLGNDEGVPRERSASAGTATSYRKSHGQRRRMGALREHRHLLRVAAARTIELCNFDEVGNCIAVLVE